jgi:aminoglycoside phosphotransferase
VLVTAGASAAPRLVVKLPRSAGDDSSLAAEAAGLRAAAGRGLDTDGGAPRLLAFERPGALGGWPTLVETALPGRALRPEVVRRRPARATDAVEPWVRRLARDAEARPAAERVARLVAAPLEPVAALGRGERDLVDRTLEVCRPLEQAVLPAVLEHGDLSHPNLLLRPGPQVGVVDWERAEPAGLPLHDLVFFLAYVAAARHRARTPEDQETAVHAEEEPTTAILRAHAGELGVPVALVAPLVVACWARATADAWARGDGDAHWLRAARVTRLWRRALAAAEDEREGAVCASST